MAAPFDMQAADAAVVAAHRAALRGRLDLIRPAVPDVIQCANGAEWGVVMPDVVFKARILDFVVSAVNGEAPDYIVGQAGQIRCPRMCAHLLDFQSIQLLGMAVVVTVEEMQQGNRTFHYVGKLTAGDEVHKYRLHCGPNHVCEGCVSFPAAQDFAIPSPHMRYVRVVMLNTFNNERHVDAMAVKDAEALAERAEFRRQLATMQAQLAGGVAHRDVVEIAGAAPAAPVAAAARLQKLQVPVDPCTHFWNLAEWDRTWTECENSFQLFKLRFREFVFPVGRRQPPDKLLTAWGDAVRVMELAAECGYRCEPVSSAQAALIQGALVVLRSEWEAAQVLGVTGAQILAHVTATESNIFAVAAHQLQEQQARLHALGQRAGHQDNRRDAARNAWRPAPAQANRGGDRDRCTFCGKSGHAFEECYSRVGRPSAAVVAAPRPAPKNGFGGAHRN